MLINFILILFTSYLVGSISNGYILVKRALGIDIRTVGSGSTGATNVKRVLGEGGFLKTLFLDALKGAFVVVVVTRLYLFRELPFENPTPFDNATFLQLSCGILAMVGHVWTIFLSFKGGKGIATALGFLIGIVTIEIIIAFTIFYIVLKLSHYLSLGSMLAAISLPITLAIRENIFHVNIQGYGTLWIVLSGISALIILTHLKNIGRLLSGRENKFYFNFKKLFQKNNSSG